MSQKSNFQWSDGTLNPTKGCDTLADAFVWIRNDYFPDWTDGANWKIVAYQGTAFCDRENRTIKIGPKNRWPVPVVLIHEIAHAVTVDDHGPRWEDRLRETIKRAKEFGQDELAQELDKHLEFVSSPGAYDVPPEEVDDEIRRAVSAQPASTFEQVVDAVARGFGQTRTEFEDAYPGMRAVFDETRRVIAAQAQRRHDSPPKENHG